MERINQLNERIGNLLKNNQEKGVWKEVDEINNNLNKEKKYLID